MAYANSFLRKLRVPLSIFGQRRNNDADLNIPLIGTPDYSFYSLVSDITSQNKMEERFTATAAQTTFTLAKSIPAPSGNNLPILVFRNGVKMKWVASDPSTRQFTYSGTTLTLAAQSLNDQIEVYY